MGSSFVTLDQNGSNPVGFWERDGYLQSLLYILCREIALSGTVEEWLSQFRGEWRLQLENDFNGCMTLFPKEIALSAERREILTALVQSAVAGMVERGSIAFGYEPPRLRARDPGAYAEGPVEDVSRTANLLLSLLSGRLPTTASSPLEYGNYLQAPTRSQSWSQRKQK